MTKPRVAFLDGLRGIAALMVVFCHSAGALFPAVLFGTSSTGLSHVLYAAPILDIPFQGNFMVCVFYALSGLALSYHTLSRHSRAPAISGLARRYPRLMIPVLAGILLAAGMLALSLLPVKEASLLSGSQWWGKYWQFQPSLGSALREGTVGVFRVSHSTYDPPLWTMHTELLGSILVFAVLILSPRRWVRVAAYIVLAWYFHDGYLLAFVGGMAICEAWIALGDRPRRWAPLLIPIGVYGLLLGSYPIPSATTPRFYGRITPDIFGPTALDQQIGAHVLGAIFVLATVVAVVPLRRPLEMAWASFLGRISFALYIVHFIVLGSLGAGLLIALQHVLPYTVNAVVAYGAVVVGSIAASWVFTRMIDEPTVAATGQAYRALLAQLRRLTGRESRALTESDAPATIAPEPS
ncbi:MAG: acyltransferase family protein [Acidimicrobiia bacterium]